MPTQKHYKQNGTLKGHAVYQIDHLKQLGYNMSVVPVRKKYGKVDILTKKDVKEFLTLYDG